MLKNITDCNLNVLIHVYLFITGFLKVIFIPAVPHSDFILHAIVYQFFILDFSAGPAWFTCGFVILVLELRSSRTGRFSPLALPLGAWRFVRSRLCGWWAPKSQTRFFVFVGFRCDFLPNFTRGRASREFQKKVSETM